MFPPGSAQRKTRTQAEIKERGKKRREMQTALRNKELAQGLKRATNPSVSNRKSAHQSLEDEKAERELTLSQFIDAVRPQLPALIQSLGSIKDFRNPKKIKHQLEMVLFYGILCFVLQMSSRREANRELTGPQLLAHLQQLFPQMKEIAHQDTLARLLAGIDVEQLQTIHMAMIFRLIRNKKFNRWLLSGRYPIAVDGTQKAVRKELVSEQWLRRRINADKENESVQYYVYVLEATMVFPNGLSLPLLTEFLNYQEGDTETDKQDCELKAFKRLASRLKSQFPRLPLMLLLDGLYPNGPVFRTCRQNRWQFMIVLKDNSLPSLWEEYNGLRELEPGQQAERTWANRRQHFRWVNDIVYYYGKNDKCKEIVHVVVCQETWQEVDADGTIVEKSARHAWVSSEPLTKGNLHERCNLGARHRWGIEEAILVEKCHGYGYEHLYSLNWEAMKGYHYLMHLGHALFALAQYSEHLLVVVRRQGVRAFIKYTRRQSVPSLARPRVLVQQAQPKTSAEARLNRRAASWQYRLSQAGQTSRTVPACL